MLITSYKGEDKGGALGITSYKGEDKGGALGIGFTYGPCTPISISSTLITGIISAIAFLYFTSLNRKK
jgi:hypothetical protein